MADEAFAREPVEDNNPLLRWREYIYILYERRWIAITVFSVALAGAILWNERQVPLYRARVRLQVDPSTQRILNIPDVVAMGAPGYLFHQYVNTQVKALQSRTFAEKVVESVAEAPPSPLRRVMNESGDPVEIVLDALSVRPVEDSRLIDVTTQHTDPGIAAALANAVADQFVQQDLDRRMGAAMGAVKWLREQAEAHRVKLHASELALQEFREETRMVSLEQRQDIVVSKLKDVSQSLTEAQTARISAQAKWDEVQGLQVRDIVLSDIPAIRADSQVEKAWQDVTDARNEVTRLSKRYLEKHPSMVAAVTAVGDAEIAHGRACRDAADRIKAAYELAVAKEDGLGEALREQEALALALDRKMMEYSELRRRADADQELYQSILRRMKEADLAGKLETTNIRIIDRAHVPERAFTPRKALNLVRACGAGLILGIILSFLVHLMDDRVRRTEDFEISLGVPVVGTVPWIDMASPSERASITKSDPDSQGAEAFRGLRAGLLLNASGREADRIVVLSAGAAEGKSFVAANLAASFANNHQLTLLIDADMRRPTVHRLLDLQDGPGLPSILAGRVAWDDVVVKTAMPLLEVIPGRGAKARPAELLSSTALAEFLANVAEVYDRVIIDSPPLFGASDPLLLLPHVDGVLFVAMYNRTRRRAAEEAVHELQSSETPLLGAVLNGIDTGGFGYYYRRYGYDHYYYGSRIAES